MEAPAPFAFFPDSLLLQILVLLPVRDRLNVARVCKRWRRLVQDKLLWRHLDLTPYKMSSKVLWHLLRNHLRGNLRTLRARGSLHSVLEQKVFSPSPGLMKALGKQCPNFHHLCLSEVDLCSVSYNCLPPSLTTLELSRCEINFAWFRGRGSSQTSPRIQHLVIRNVPAFSDQHLLDIARRVTLKTLVLSGAYRVTNSGVLNAVAYLRELESLTLCQCRVSNSVTRVISHHLKCLRLLDLSRYPNLTDKCLPDLSSLASLEDLRLTDCFRLSPEAIAATCRVLPQLKRLDLSHNRFNQQIIHKIQAELPNCVVTCAARVLNCPSAKQCQTKSFTNKDSFIFKNFLFLYYEQWRRGYISA